MRVLRRHAGGAGWLENLLEAELARDALTPPDRALVQELCFGVVRWQAALDWLIARKTAGRTQNAVLQILLRLGLYQLFWLDRIPDHAAVHETVQMTRELGFGPKAGFVNALLRGCLRERETLEGELAALQEHEPHLGCSHPQWLCARWEQRWGREKLRALLDWNNTPPPVFARVNSLKATAEKLARQFESEGVQFTPRAFDWAPPDSVFELRSHPPLASLPSFQQGFFYVQDPSTLLAVHELKPQPGEAVLDLCAAPGGKTTFIAQLMRNEGAVRAQDVDKERLKLIQDNCDRLGVTCVTVAQSAAGAAEPPTGFDQHDGGGERLPPGKGEYLLSGVRPSPGAETDGSSEASSISTACRPSELSAAEDGRTPLNANKGEGRGEGEGHARSTSALRNASQAAPGYCGQFDRILIDAPCSNTGVMRRRVDLRWRIQPAEIERLRRVQLELLGQAGASLKPGGTLVYSTCSLEPEENGSVVQEFLADRKEFRLECERALIPFADAVDGAYVARLVANAGKWPNDQNDRHAR